MIWVLLPLSIVCELIDSSLGMMYGTLLSPLLIMMGFDAKLVVPSVLLSQAVGGGISTIGHHQKNNANFKGMTNHTKIALSIIVPGVLACILGAWVGVQIPKLWLNIYIGSIVVIMGILCVTKLNYTFTWTKMYLVGLLSGFNKAMSGGGFGPVTSTGKILSGVDSKVSVATTTYAEVPICFASFLVWILLNGAITLELPAILCVGALIGGLIGPSITAKFKTNKLRIIVGILALACGIWVITKAVI